MRVIRFISVFGGKDIAAQPSFVHPFPKDCTMNTTDNSRKSHSSSRAGEDCMQIAKTPAVADGKSRKTGISIDFMQATYLLAMFGGEPGEITQLVGPGHSGDGLYAYCTELPEEGVEYLGVTDDEAVPFFAITQGA